jgi:HSP20 family protein
MGWEEDWFKRWRRFPFFNRFFEDIDKMMEEMFKEMTPTIPKDLVRERKLPDGSIERELGPFVYGYSMTLGPEGKPIIREFGNIKPTIKQLPPGIPKPTIEVEEKREPLIDIMEEKGVIKVIAELPGVEKSDITLNCTAKSLTISVDTVKRKYYKELELPTEVDPNLSKATYKNGVLEVTLTKAKKIKPEGKSIPIE